MPCLAAASAALSPAAALSHSVPPCLPASQTRQLANPPPPRRPQALAARRDLAAVLCLLRLLPGLRLLRPLQALPRDAGRPLFLVLFSSHRLASASCAGRKLAGRGHCWGMWGAGLPFAVAAPTPSAEHVLPRAFATSPSLHPTSAPSAPLPAPQLLLQRLMSSMWLPPASILRWLEEHAQFRLSILLTYLFGKSEAFVQLVRWGGNVARVRPRPLRSPKLPCGAHPCCRFGPCSAREPSSHCSRRIRPSCPSRLVCRACGWQCSRQWTRSPSRWRRWRKRHGSLACRPGTLLPRSGWGWARCSTPCWPPSSSWRRTPGARWRRCWRPCSR